MPKNASIEEVSRNLHSAALHLLRYVRTQDSALGVGPAQLSALSVIVFGGPLSLNELAKAEQVRPPTMSRVVDALVKAGLVKRELNRSDRRSVTITATPKGISLMHEGRSLREKQLVNLLKPLAQSELEQLQRASEIIARTLTPQY